MMMAPATDPAITPALLDPAPSASGAVVDVFADAVLVGSGRVVEVLKSAVAVADVEVWVVVEWDIVLSTPFVCCGTSDVYTAWFSPMTQYGVPPPEDAHL
jgi:hypothetical protein